MKRLICLTILAVLALAGVASAAPPKPCDQHCLEAKFAKLETRVASLEAAAPVQLVSVEGSGSLFSQVEQPDSEALHCPEGFVAISNEYTVNGAGADFFGSELFQGGESSLTFIGGGSPEHPIQVKPQLVCIRGEYVVFGE